MNDSPELSPWEVLGVEAQADERTIKRAYARRLKEVRPDEKPQEFQQLRSAYEYALAMAAQQAEMPALAATSAQEEPQAAAEPAVVNYSERHVVKPQVQHVKFANRPTSGEIAHNAWQAFLNECIGLVEARNSSQFAPLDAILGEAKTRLAAILKLEDFESLAVREEFKQIALAYCSHPDALPVVRLACLEVLKWEEERMLVNYYTTQQAQIAIDRAVADKQYEFLLDKAQRSEAVRVLLMPQQEQLPWRKFFKTEFVSDMRNCLSHIRRSMPEVEYFRIGPEVVNRWIDAIDRPWPTSPALLAAFAAGFGIAALGAALMKPTASILDMPASLGDVGVLLACLLLFLLPPALAAGYPRYAYPVLNKMRSDRRIHMGCWGAHVLLSSLAFGLNLLPGDFVAPVFILLLMLAIVDLYLKRQLTASYIAFSFMMFGFTGMLLANALSPYMNDLGFLMAAAANGLFLSLRFNLLHFYGKDWYRARPRAILLGAGIVIAAVEYFLAPYLPRGAALLGWWWILIAVGAADLFCLQFVAGKDGVAGFLWILGLAAIFYLPRSIDIDSPVAGMFHLQITVAAALVIGLIRNGWEYWRVRQAKNNRPWYE